MIWLQSIYVGLISVGYTSTNRTVKPWNSCWFLMNLFCSATLMLEACKFYFNIILYCFIFYCLKIQMNHAEGFCWVSQSQEMCIKISYACCFLRKRCNLWNILHNSPHWEQNTVPFLRYYVIIYFTLVFVLLSTIHEVCHLGSSQAWCLP